MRRTRLLMVWALACVLPLPVIAQDDTRGLVPERFLRARPAGKANAHAAYRLLTPQLGKGDKALELGVTVWRLRPARATDDGPRLLVQASSETTEYTPVRVEAGSPLKTGDRVRLSIESPRSGYLYVVDREEYADGSKGDPYLIFPTTRTRGGDNQVVPGRVMEIPAQDDSPPYFTLRPSRSDQTGELLTIVVTQTPLKEVAIGSGATRLSPSLVAEWSELGKGKIERMELEGGAGKAWSRAEQAAGVDGTRLLKQDDPPPQTIFRVLPGKPDFLPDNASSSDQEDMARA